MVKNFFWEVLKMEVIATILFCAICFFAYLANANNNEILKLKNSIRESELEKQYLLDEKEKEISNLKNNFQIEKNKLLRQPIANRIETSSLKEQFDKNRGEIQELQKKLHDRENIISSLKQRIADTQNFHSIQSEKLRSFKSENENLKIIISQLKRELEEKKYSYNIKSNTDELSLLKRLLNATQKENINLKTQISKLDSELRELKTTQKKTVSQGTLFNDYSVSEKFVQVVFRGFSDKRHDYFLGKHKNISVGDIVLVGTKNGAKPAQVVRISEPGEFSAYANSNIIKKLK